MSDIVALLKSPNPAERKQGIKLLVKSNHPDALRYLAAIYKKDTDVSVREMALKAGQYLKEQAAAEAAAAEADYGYQDDSYDYDETSYADEEEVYVDEARFQAADRKSAGGTASKSKKKLKNDEKLKHEEDGEKAVSWGDAFLDLALYGLFTGAATFLMILFIVSFVQNLSQALFYTLDPMMAQEFNTMLSSLGLGIGIVYAIFGAIGGIIGLMIWMGLIHVASAFMLGGNGTYTGLIHRVTVPMIIWTIISAVLTIVGFYLALSNIPTDPSIYENETLFLQEMQGFSSTLNGLNGINGLLSIGFTLWMAHIIGTNYRFGMGKGCVSMILSYVIMFVLLCGCIFTITSILTSSATAAYSGY